MGDVVVVPGADGPDIIVTPDDEGAAVVVGAGSPALTAERAERVAADAALQAEIDGIVVGGGAVTSVNGRAGVVTGLAEQSALDAEAVTARAAEAGLTASLAAFQPLDSDLSAIAALVTTSFGRAFLTLADAAAGRSTLALGSAALSATSAFDAAGAAAAAQAASQPLDSDLTAIAALTTTSYGRAFLGLADAAAGRTALGLGSAATQPSTAFDAAGAATAAQAASQPLDADLTAIAALATTSYGRALLTTANLVALQAILGTGTPSSTTYLRGDGTWATPAGGGGGGDLLSTNNLSDLASVATARSNLGLGTAATANKVAAGVAGVLDATDATTTNSRTPTAHAASHAPAGSDDLTTALSAVAVPVALGTAAVGSGTGFARQGHVHPTTGLLLPANNLSDVANVATSRTNLGVYSTAQVDALIAAIPSKAVSQYATAAALPACTYANGTAGVGATLTANANGPLTVDGQLVAAGTTVLVQNQASTFQNGPYTVTQPGVVAVSPFILTRRADYDSAAEMATAATFPVDSEGLTPGSTNDQKVFLSVTSSPFTPGTTGMTFAQVGGVYTATGGVQLSGNQFSLTDLTAAGPSGSATVVPVVTVDVKGRVTALTTASIAIPESAVTGLGSDLALKAPLASPALTGTPTVPTAAQGTNTTQAASTAYVQTEVGLLVPKSLIPNVGDIIVSAGVGGVGALSVGASGTVLTADSSAAGGLSYQNPRAFRADLAPASSLGETFARPGATLVTLGATFLTSQRLHLVAVWLPVGASVTSITFVNGTTALSGGNHQWFALFGSTRGMLAQTTDDTSTAWASNAAKTLSLATNGGYTTPYVTTYSGLHYLGVLVDASTVPSLEGTLSTGTGATNILGTAPIVNGSSTTGQTTRPTGIFLAAALTATLGYPYAYVS